MHSQCFAPPISEQTLAGWTTLAQELGGTVGWLIIKLIGMVHHRKHGSRKVIKVPDDDMRTDCLREFAKLAEPYRTPAYHLLWYVTELTLRRPPE